MTVTEGRPAGYTALTPFLVCSPASAAIDFYTAVFGATVVERMDGPDGVGDGRADGGDPGRVRTVAHAELDLGAGRLQLGDPNPEYGLVAPDGDRTGDSSSICLYVPDVDAVFAAAVAAGATVREEPSTFVTGDRFCSIRDPYGHRWAIMTRVEDVPPEEARRRLARWAATQP